MPARRRPASRSSPGCPTYVRQPDRKKQGGHFHGVEPHAHDMQNRAKKNVQAVPRVMQKNKLFHGGFGGLALRTRRILHGFYGFCMTCGTACFLHGFCMTCRTACFFHDMWNSLFFCMTTLPGFLAICAICAISHKATHSTSTLSGFLAICAICAISHKATH